MVKWYARYLHVLKLTAWTLYTNPISAVLSAKMVSNWNKLQLWPNGVRLLFHVDDNQSQTTLSCRGYIGLTEMDMAGQSKVGAVALGHRHSPATSPVFKPSENAMFREQKWEGEPPKEPPSSSLLLRLTASTDSALPYAAAPVSKWIPSNRGELFPPSTPLFVLS